MLGVLEKQGYETSLKQSKLFEKKATLCGIAIAEKEVSPNEDKVAAVMKINPPKTLKEVKCFVGSLQYLTKYIPDLATKLQPIRNMLKKKTT